MEKRAYTKMSQEELQQEYAELLRQADEIRARGLKLDMARGKPSSEQIELSKPMLDVLNHTSDMNDQGQPADNYGVPDGLPSIRALGAELLGADVANVIACGSSSLNLMFDLVSHACLRGVCGSRPWSELEKPRFLCPSPGYDRHFAITQYLGFENVLVPMGSDGPDMDMVEELVKDENVKGIWCVPKYSNPTGVTYSDEVVRRFAALKPAAEDFRIFWDNAYIVHDLFDEGDELLDIKLACKQVGSEDMVYEFASTAKVTFPSSGVAFVCASDTNMADIRSLFAVMRVSPEKLTQLMHLRYFDDLASVRAHMKKHAEIVRPRFELVWEKLEQDLSGLEIASWTHPRGGYFISFDGLEGTAKRSVELAAELGVVLTPAGAAFPGGLDPKDTNIRIAPTFPSLDELESALEVFTLAVRLAALEKLGGAVA